MPLPRQRLSRCCAESLGRMLQTMRNYYAPLRVHHSKKRWYVKTGKPMGRPPGFANFTRTLKPKSASAPNSVASWKITSPSASGAREHRMATQAEYTAVANALQKLIQADVNADVPGWAQGMIPADLAPSLAGACAKLAVDTLDAYRAKEAPK